MAATCGDHVPFLEQGCSAHASEEGLIKDVDTSKVGKGQRIALSVALVSVLALAAFVGFRSPGNQKMAPSEAVELEESHDCKHGYIGQWTSEKKQWCCWTENKGCEHNVAAPYDCDAGYSNWKKGWSEPKKSFCCDHFGKGCSDKAPKYDCHSGIEQADTLWTKERRQWCCINERQACPAFESPYDCQAGVENAAKGWATGKKDWCCKHYQLGCSDEDEISEPFDCEAGFSDWQDGWSDSKKAWCCVNKKKGCGVGGDVTYDCEAGYFNWRAGWAAEKKSWCCMHEFKGCPSKFDCNRAREDYWSGEEREYCCDNLHYGCRTTTDYPFDCAHHYDHWETVWSSEQQLWCCESFGRGCSDKTTAAPTTPKPDVVIGDDAFDYGFDCDAGYSNWKSGWSKLKKDYCCRRLGRGCE